MTDLEKVRALPPGKSTKARPKKCCSCSESEESDQQTAKVSKRTKSTKVTVSKGKVAHAKTFSGKPTWQDLEKMAQKIKNKKVLYLYKCQGNYLEYRIRTDEDLEQLIDAGVLVADWNLRIKFKFF